MGTQGCCEPAGEASVRSLEAAEVFTVYMWIYLHVWVHAGHPICS